MAKTSQFYHAWLRLTNFTTAAARVGKKGTARAYRRIRALLSPPTRRASRTATYARAQDFSEGGEPC